ncbi:MAG: hypothetical protein ACLFP2_03020 [Candidatus Woesearchaeota archaeon]
MTEQIERWAEFVKNNPSWKKEHTKLIDAQFAKSKAFYDRLSKTKNGKKKIVEIFGIKNKNGFPKLFSN